MTEERIMEENERTVLFTDTYTTDEKTDRQMFRRIRRLPRLLVFALSTAFLAYLVYLFVTMLQWSKETGEPLSSNSSVWILVLGVLLYALIVVRELLAPDTFSKRQARQLKESYGTEHITIEASFSDDAVDFHNQASDADMRVPYASLNLLTETEDLFLIRTAQRQVIALSKAGLDGTDVPGFRAFMDEKCPNAKRKWRKAK